MVARLRGMGGEEPGTVTSCSFMTNSLRGGHKGMHEMSKSRVLLMWLLEM